MSKKTAKATKEFRKYSIGDHVLGKVRGYPPWPGMVVDPDTAPQAVLNEQPPGKKSTFHCVIFFPMGDYAWLHPKDLSSLKPHEIEPYLADESKKRSGDLREGYRIALDPTEWLADNKKRQAAAAQQVAEDQEQVDQLDSETEDGDQPKKSKSSKKRKRDLDVDHVRDKKTPMRPKKESAESAKKKTKSRKNGKSKSMVESEDDGEHARDDDDDDAGPSKASPPPAKKVRHDKDDDGDPQSIKVRDWRHKLQKTFLSHKTLPKAEAMADIDELFTMVENYHDMTIEQLQFSKIGKVMRHIAALPDEKVPRDSDFMFRTRAKGLVEKWHDILHNANRPGAESPGEVISFGHLNGKPEVKDGDEKITEEMAEDTKNLDLNGKDESFRSLDMEQSTVEGDTSLLADVTMSETA